MLQPVDYNPILNILSVNGLKMAINSIDGSVFQSTNVGTSWRGVNLIPGNVFQFRTSACIAISDDGKYVVEGTQGFFNEGILTSSNYGQTYKNTILPVGVLNAAAASSTHA